MSLSEGARLGSYEITARIGRGGMGEVYRASHLRLGREVAIKILSETLVPDRRQLERFEREAKLASSLNHPSIITIHDIGEQDGTVYIVMELIRGQSLREVLREGSLTIANAVGLAEQVADALARAHEAGVLHRDLKPENIMVTPDGRAKILDFGLATQNWRHEHLTPDSPTVEQITEEGAIVGTPRYMSPEQLSGEVIDHRADQFAFGIVLYELLSGRAPFDGPSLSSLVTDILTKAPTPLRKIREEIPRELAALIERCLEKKAADRHESMSEVHRRLREVRAQRESSRGSFVSPGIIAGTAAAIILAIAIGALLWWRGADDRWARDEASAEISAQVEDGNLYEAYSLGIRATALRPDDPELRALFEGFTIPLTIDTRPTGAIVNVTKYDDPDAPWTILGTTPVDVRIPYALMRWRIEKEGYEPFEGAPFSAPSFISLAALELDAEGTRPPGMARVPAGVFRDEPRAGLESPSESRRIPIGAYWLDRFEVTNEEYKQFVDAGGYRDPTFWTDSIPVTGESLADLTEPFRDLTGRSGPAGWSLGTFPEGGGNLPVGGVSWHEGAAYCRFMGKTLPTLYHWKRAIGQEQLSGILQLSNFHGDGPSPVGSRHGLSGFGAYDLAGNVTEWCWSGNGLGDRYILGGAWNDPPYMFRREVARPPGDRQPTNGFRCAIYTDPVDEAAFEPVGARWKMTMPPPITGEVFEAYRGMYGYDRTGLEARVERVDDSSPHWRRETVSFKTAYDDERMQAILLLPRNTAPPYQAVIWFPGDDVFIHQSSESLAGSYLFDFLPKSGRAVVYPIYDGMYERHAEWKRTPNEWRDMVIRWSKDFSRTIDYLETRDDIDSGNLAYYGFSSGAQYGPILTTVDRRVQTAILLGGGLNPVPMKPEMNSIHFASRSPLPTLMINGADDFINPHEDSQKPFFDLLGAAPEDKRFAVLEGGHIPNHLQIIREVLDWLDHRLGPVETKTVDAS